MMDPWSTTVAVLAGSAAELPRQWPAARTRRIQLCDNPVPADAPAPLGDADREVLDALANCPMSGGQIAYVLGIGLEAAYARVSRLHARGLLRKNGRLWELAARRGVRDAVTGPS